MPKLIVCVKSCHRDRDRGCHDAVRSTWGAELRKLGIETRFFLGTSERPSTKLVSDEVELNCTDTYIELPFKTREIARWASGKMVDHFLLTDNDTLIISSRLAKVPLKGIDYTGTFSWPHNQTKSYNLEGKAAKTETISRCYGYASGAAYILSRKACAIIGYEFPNSWAEDVWVGQVLGPLAAEGKVWVEELNSRFFAHPIMNLDEEGDPLKAMKYAEARYGK